MILPDVNVLIFAHRRDATEHERYRSWLEDAINGEAPFGLSELVLAGFVRVATHPRVFDPPSRLGDALAFLEALRARPNAVIVAPGSRHWGLFIALCERSKTKGNLVPDAYNAALAIESGSEWITTDRDYARFPGLMWRHPLEPAR